MTLSLTKETLRTCYDFLCETSPFSKWNLPDSDDVEFKVARAKDHYGWHYYDDRNRRHTIAISGATVNTMNFLISVMAHEMIHVHERQVGAVREDVQHTAAFWRWAAQVSRSLGMEI